MQKVIPRSITNLPGAQALRCVCGVMAHPGEPDRQHDFISWGLALAALDAPGGGDLIALPREIVRGLTSAAERGVRDDFDAAILGASMAGGVLTYILQARASGLTNFGIDKGQFMVSAALQPELGTGASPATVRVNWSKFRPVAHLWAAFLRVQELANQQSTGEEFVWHEHAGEFFRFAQSLLVAATKVQLHGGESLLDRHGCWELEGIEAADVQFPAFVKGDLGPLASYRPRKR